MNCDAGLAPCGGVCVKLNNDQNNCGACGNACGALDCVNSVCGGSCPADRPDDCGDCVDSQTDAANCGGCFNACDAGVACVGGVCGGGAGPACPADKPDDCGGVCTDLFTDPANCGFCGFACAAGETCGGGACVGQAAPALVDCAGQGLFDCGGVCVDLTTDAANCGLCGFACAPGETCEAEFCHAAGGAGCLAGLTDCGGGVCADLSTDPANCGGCGVACAAGETCGGGACAGQAAAAVVDCAGQGLTDCGGGVCIDTTSDPANCGGCGNGCGEGTTCVGGSCV